MAESVAGPSGPHAELIARYIKGVENFDRRVFELDDARLDTAFLPSAGVGQWPVRVLLGHLADAELVYVHRMRRTVAEDHPVLALWDENAFIDAGLYAGPRMPIGAFVAAIHTLRQWTGEWLGTLPEGAWSRRSMHPERGALTVLDLVRSSTDHLEHHADFLNRKVARLLDSAGEAQ